jgi:hypothetical protein
MAQKGNIRGLQEIFDQRQASIYDVSEGEGRTALHVGLTYHSRPHTLCQADYV